MRSRRGEAGDIETSAWMFIGGYRDVAFGAERTEKKGGVANQGERPGRGRIFIRIWGKMLEKEKFTA